MGKGYIPAAALLHVQDRVGGKGGVLEVPLVVGVLGFLLAIDHSERATTPGPWSIHDLPPAVDPEPAVRLSGGRAPGPEVAPVRQGRVLQVGLTTKT